MPTTPTVLDLIIEAERRDRETPHAPIHPGEHLLEMVSNDNLDLAGLASELDMTHEHLIALLRGQMRFSRDAAMRISRRFETTAEFWLNLQARYDVDVDAQTNATA